MKTKAVRLYGEMDLRLEEFELPEMQEDEILAEVVTDSLCMSSFKAITQAQRHKKVPNDIEEHPIILGHEFCGKILKVGKKWKDQYQEGDKFVIQPNIGDVKGWAPGYSFRYMGGDATKIIFTNQVMENGSLLKYQGDTFFEGSVVEPLSCVVGAFNAQYHMKRMYYYEHVMGIREGGAMALLGATGPMGFLAIDFAIHGPKKPSLLVVTGRTQSKIDLAKKLYTEEEAKKNGVTLIYVNTSEMDDVNAELRKYADKGYDDVFIFAPNQEMVSYGVKMLAYDGCLNFFSGPADKEFSANVNFYDIHYNSTHFIGTSGGNTEDMKQSIELIEKKTVNAAKIVTHVLGLDEAAKTTKELPQIGGGKKIVYTHHKFPLTQVDKVDEISENKFIEGLKPILKRHGYLWSGEAERYFMENAPKI
ncbi:MAG TPA: zinc-binding dehydrogenase [Candidatus Anaerostipes excrementavium]|uniref:Zinc-binding dehydrogenase n=1 Tax=Candidatus Anaerostipes excrementavium TaxID=2838463 RepID=A0A9D2B9N8_9FIRM|nr:zinc-binding dehydrogenase [uncultured Anaerostipes sp.]HIX68440.1 zinc-binding dehydrogenase [Candidatus Anaerostipes excrementavium]